MLLSIFALIGPIFFLREQRHFDFFNRAILFLMFLASMILLGFYLTGTLDYFIYQGVGSGNDNSESLIPDYLVVGSIMCIGILITLHQRNPYLYLLSGLSLFCILLIGSRGPLLFLIISSIFLILLLKNKVSSPFKGLKKIYKTSLKVIFSFTAISFLFYFGFQEGGADSTLARTVNTFNDMEELKQTFRVEEFVIAFDVIRTYPFFGVGVGGYGLEAYDMDGNIYPHNLILESAAELGLFSILIFILGLFSVFYLTFKSRSDTYICLYISILLFELLNYMKSGGFISSRDLYLFIGVLLARYEFARKLQES